MIIRKNTIEKPLIIINFKSYEEGFGDAALRLAEISEKVSKETGKCIALAPQYADIKTISQRVKLPIFAQHIDPIEAGAHTGRILPESIKDAGAIGTLINHSERQINISDIEKIILKAQSLKLKTVVCANTAKLSMAVATFNPDMVAIEPPELIGKGKAVSKVNPDIISKTVSFVRRVNPKVAILCGAGISNGDDIRAALQLGAEGVLLASGVVKSKDQKSTLMDLAINM